MKYKRGSIVEVLTMDKVPCHSWHCAKIVSGNGPNYTVRYDVYPGFTDGMNVERVPRNFIRPCPPLVELSECLVPGDMVEVFQDLSWKTAVVLEALEFDRYLVKLVGSLHGFEVSKLELRLRQSWQNDEWIVIGKVPRDHEAGRYSEFLKYNINSGSQHKQRDENQNCYMKNLCFTAQNNTLQESHIVSSKFLKRRSPCCRPQVEVNEGTTQKFRMAEKEGRRLRVLVRPPEKVDAVANTRQMPCEKDIHTSFDYEANEERQNINGAYGCPRSLNLGPNDADSVTCSVGSCSLSSYNPYETNYKSGHVEDIGGHDSDAESVCQLGYQEEVGLSPSSEKLVAEIHSLELHAYRCTMEALHASGPLSWEKETMLTDLRMSLHISNDEHLIELKELISAASSICNK